MRACDQGSQTGCVSREPAQQISAGVDGYGETSGFKLSLQPCPAFGKSRLKRTAGPGLGWIGNAAESLDAAPQPIGIDFNHGLEQLSERQIEVLEGFVDFAGVFVTDGDRSDASI